MCASSGIPLPTPADVEAVCRLHRRDLSATEGSRERATVAVEQRGTCGCRVGQQQASTLADWLATTLIVCFAVRVFARSRYRSSMSIRTRNDSSQPSRQG